MVDPVSPAPPAAPSPARRITFGPAEAAVLARLAESEFVKNLVQASLQAGQGQAEPASPENFSGQDLQTLGGDTRGGQLNLIA